MFHVMILWHLPGQCFAFGGGLIITAIVSDKLRLQRGCGGPVKLNRYVT
jgi:hypothetical protein